MAGLRVTELGALQHWSWLVLAGEGPVGHCQPARLPWTWFASCKFSLMWGSASRHRKPGHHAKGRAQLPCWAPAAHRPAPEQPARGGALGRWGPHGAGQLAQGAPLWAQHAGWHTQPPTPVCRGPHIYLCSLLGVDKRPGVPRSRA